ncbi:MAG: hypothetical protein VX399_09410, partial [SAR324 cluster bacterium]|nr:hypothetical protein [SAR324 cluster bacterium]
YTAHKSKRQFSQNGRGLPVPCCFLENKCFLLQLSQHIELLWAIGLHSSKNILHQKIRGAFRISI